MENFGPVSIFYCWQSLLLATAVWILSRISKSALLLIVDNKNKKATLWLKNVIMPSIPLVFGMLLVMIVPILPDELVAYTKAQGDVRAWAYNMAYGACIGQFSSYLHDRMSGLMAMKSPTIEVKDVEASKAP